MAGPFTRTLDFSRRLLRVYQIEGRVQFEAALSRHMRFLMVDCGQDPKTLNSRLMTLLSGMLSVLLIGRSDEIIRKQVDLSEKFSYESDPEQKTAWFVEDLTGFLDQYEAQQKTKMFSDQVLYHLAAYSLPELRKATVYSIAERFGYNASYFSTKFKKERGTKLQDFINIEKLNRAYFLLKEEQKTPIHEIADSVGFTDVPYFRNLFKKHFGFSPSQLPK